MKTVSELLETKYQSFINEEDEWLFFASLADYIDLILKQPETEPILKQLNDERDELLRKEKDTDESAKKVLLALREKITKVIADNGINDTELKAIDEHIDMLLDGRLSTSSTPAEYVFHCLHDYCLRVQTLGHIELLLKDFCVIQENGYAKTRFEDLLKEARQIRGTVNRKRDDSMWGALNHLLIVREIFFDAQEKLDQFSAEGLTVRAMDYYCYVREMNEIREGKSNTTIQGNKFTRGDRLIFKQRDFKIFTNRIHFFLMSELLRIEQAKKEQAPTSDFELDFDIEESFEVWVKSDPSRRWQMKRNREFTKMGKAMAAMLQSAGECVLPSSQHEETIKNLKPSLASKLNLRGNEVKILFMRKENMWGIEKRYLSR